MGFSIGSQKPSAIGISSQGPTEIDNLERLLVLGRTQLLEAHGVPPAELARERAAVETLAANVCQQLRDEYRARTRR